MDTDRRKVEAVKTTVAKYLETKVNNGLASYLEWPMSRWERSLLMRYRINIVHHMLCFPLCPNINDT